MGPYHEKRALKRGIFSDLKDDVGGVLSKLGSKIPANDASVPNFFQKFPIGDKVQNSLGIDDS